MAGTIPYFHPLTLSWAQLCFSTSDTVRPVDSALARDMLFDYGIWFMDMVLDL